MKSKKAIDLSEFSFETKRDVNFYIKEKFKDLNDNGVMPIPKMIMLETLSKCNAICSFCPANSLVDNR